MATIILLFLAGITICWFTMIGNPRIYHFIRNKFLTKEAILNSFHLEEAARIAARKNKVFNIHENGRVSKKIFDFISCATYTTMFGKSHIIVLVQEIRSIPHSHSADYFHPEYPVAHIKISRNGYISAMLFDANRRCIARKKYLLLEEAKNEILTHIKQFRFFPNRHIDE